MSGEPYYRRGDVEIWNSDCRDLLASFVRVDAIVTDPPYGVAFSGKKTKHSESSSGYLSGDDSGVGPDVIRAARELDVRCVVTPGIALMFEYPKPDDFGVFYCPSGAGLGKWGFVGAHPILYYGKCPYLANGMGHRPNSFTSFDTQKPNGHPCPKPVGWMTRLVMKASAFEGDTILDPFCGSGTTLVASLMSARKCIGIEREEKYCEIAARRCDAEIDQKRIEFTTTKEVQKGLFDVAGN